LRRAFDQLEEAIAGAALIVVVLAVCWGVITRYITAQPAAWASEVAAFAFAWCVFVGSAAVVKRGGHVSVDMLTNALPRRLRDGLAVAARLLGLGFCCVAALLAVDFSIRNYDNPSAVLRLPLSILYLAPATGFALMALRTVQGLIGHAWAR
jgi:TRAP-type C4-dicarboxylate transport system permease small subunit